MPLWRTIEKVWSSDRFAASGSQGPCLPTWFSSFRVSELQRLLEFSYFDYVALLTCTHKYTWVVAGVRSSRAISRG